MSTQSQTSVMKLYHSVIEDVIAGVRDSFLDEGVDEQVLQELKQIWETKLLSSKALELNPEPPEPQPPQIGNQKDGRSNLSGKSVNIGNQMTVFTTNQHGTQQIIGTQQTQLVQQVGQQPTTQSQPVQQQTQVQQNSQHLVQQSQQGQQTQASQQTTTVITADPNKQVPIHITLPAQAGAADSQPRVLTIQVPASALQGNQLHTVLTGPIIAATMALPQHLASSLLQQHVTAALQGQAASGASQMQQLATVGAAVAQNSTSNGSVMAGRQVFQQTTGTIRQLDGVHDTSDEDEDDDDDDDDDIDEDDENDDKDDDENEEENDGGPEEEPLNSEDDVSDEDPTDLFDTDNVVVCQYDKITRSRNKWKFYLKDGIMNLSGKDYVFQKANGDAEW
ncbi:transcription initiation factor IIA subunit 1 isoform X2 [Zootermopsis nevadensis]|uniref:Transcription initiation factor IIA subunit 1 n=1 Tax=Zootermopsis nevadensis TaxID=136037 RepID=A0A067RDB9_ZOONE|nr:transcription initiation factor IIA subunit 1 isoform X2 [Zootermopsis nevadensis]KDR16773.1 Transcription initiation factor IIA subunit 1 [Zootermopsis nevadensis]